MASPQLAKYYYKYTGSALKTTWTPAVDADTDVVFQVLDSNGVKATGDEVSVGGGGGGGGGDGSISIQSVLVCLVQTASLKLIDSHSCFS